MITIKDIRDKVAQYPENGQVGALLEELVLMYKVEQGIKEADEGKGLTLAEFKEEIASWQGLK